MKKIFVTVIFAVLGIGMMMGQSSRCQSPTGLNVSYVTRNSATLGWTLGAGTEAPGAYFLTVTDNNGQTIISDSTLVAPGLSAPLMGLQPNTTYHVTLQGDCRSEYAGISGTGTLTFTTLCEETPLPWANNFDVVTDGIECTLTSNATYADGAVKLRSTGTEVAYIMFPLMDADIDKMEMDYSVRRGGDVTEVEYMIGAVLNPSEIIETFIPFATYTASSTDWEVKRINTSALSARTDTAAAICILVQSGLASELWIDNVNIHAKPNCLRVENVRVDQANINSVRVWFNTDGESNFTVKCASATDTVIAAASSSPFTMTGLASNKTYTATVMRNCAGEQSEESLPAYFNTLCPVAPTAIMSEDFSGESLPVCWQVENGWLCTEKLPFQAGTYDVNLGIYREANDADLKKGIEVWLTPEAGDTTGAIKLAKIPFFFGVTPEEDTAGWFRYSYPVNATGDYYIMLKGESKDESQNWRFNELSVTVIPTCREIANVGKATSNQTSITIPWTAGGTETSWVVVYEVVSGTSIVQTDSVTVNQPQLTITGLASSTEYTITGGIYAKCQPSDISARHEFMVRKQTKCPAATVPYSENFEAYGNNTVPQCWDGEKWVVYTHGVNDDATRVLRLNNPDQLTGVATTYSRNVTLTAGENYLVRFDWASTLCRGEMSDYIPTLLKISTDNGATSTLIDSLPSNIADLEFMEFEISQWAGNDVIIIFESETSHGNGSSMIDNFEIVRKPTCAGMKQPTISNVTTNSAIVTISDQTVTEWDVTWGAAGSIAGTGNVVRVSGRNTDTLTGLVAQRAYDVYVRRVCGTDIGEWTRKPVSFTTTCMASMLPIEESFESMQSGKLDDCFTHSTVNSFQYTVIGNATYNHTESGFKGIVSAKTGQTTIMPTATKAEETSVTLQAYKYVQLEAGKNYEVSMWMRNEESNNENFDCQVKFVVGSQIENVIEVGGAIVADNDWMQAVSYFTVPADGDYFVGFKTSAYNTLSYKFIADDYRIAEVGCIPPLNCMISQKNTTSATVSFTGSQSATRYELELDGEMYDTTITSNYYTITGLAQNNEYSFRMRSVCQEGKSSWSEPVTFRTRCDGETLPYSENFEKSSSTDCWSSIGNGRAMRVSNQSHSGNSSYYISEMTVMLPEMNTTSLANYSMGGWIYTNTASNIGWGVMTDPDDISTYEELGAINVLSAYTWAEFEVSFDSLADAKYASVANARYIVIALTQGIEAYIDDIAVYETPDCRKPRNISYSNITSTSITVNWDEIGNARNWQVEAIPEGSKGYLQSRTTNTKPVVFNGLKAGAAYRFEIRSICGQGDTSEVAYGSETSTQCGQTTAPMIETFEDSRANAAPSCWMVTSSSSAMTHRLWYVMGQGDNHYVRVCTSWIRSKETVEMTSQNIALASGKQWELSLDYAHQASCGPLEVMVRRSTEAKFVTIGTISKDSIRDENVPHSWTKAIFNISSYAGSNIIIMLKATGDNGQGAIFVDNIEVKEIRSCKDVQSVVANAGETEAFVTITDTIASHTSWQYVFGRKGIDPENSTIQSTTNKKFTLTGLQNETEYDIYVRTACSGSSYGNWARASFKTMNNPSPMPYVCDFSDEDENSNWGIASTDDAASVFAIGNCSTAVKSGTKALYVSTDGGNTYLYNLSVAGTSVAYRLFYFGTGRYQFEIDWQCPGGHIETPYDYARIYLQPANRAVDIAQPGYYYARNYPQDLIPLDGNRPFAKVSGGWTMTNETLDMTDREGYYYLVFVWSNNDSYGTAEYPLSVNDITVRKLNCQGVSSITPTTITATSITAKVKGGSGLKWIVNDENSMDTPLMSGNGTNDSTVTVTGLDGATKYWLFVSNQCGDNTRSEWKSLEFTTSCSANTIYPYSETFNGAEFPPTCWSISGNGSWQRYVDNYNDGNAHTGDAAQLRGSSGSITRLVSPAMHIDAARDYKLTFWMSRSMMIYINDELKVLIGPNKNSTTGAKTLGTWTTYDPNTEEVVQISCDLPSTLATGNYYIMFEGHHNSGYVIIDDIEVTQYPVCRDFETKPTVINNAMTEVTVQIEKGKRDTIEFGYALNNGNTAAIIGTVKSTTGIGQITGLTANTTYTIYARGLCSNHDTTAWSTGTTVTTQTSNCYAPVALRAVGNVGFDEITLTWGGAPNATQYEYEIVPTSGTTIRGTTTQDTIHITGLSARTQYTARVRCRCSATDSTAWETFAFRTTQSVATSPYFTGFESSADNAQWDHVMSSFCNKFCFGTGVKKSGSYAMYVSKNGSSKDIELPASTAYSTSYADYMTRLAHLNAGVYEFTFDWRCNAYNQSVNSPAWRAFGRAFIVPEGTTFTADVNTYYSGAPANAIEIYPGEMELKKDWQHQKTFVTIAEEGNYMIVFAWLAQRTQYATSSDVGTRTLVIDNFGFEEMTCLPVQSLTVASKKHDEVKVKVTRATNDSIEWALLTVNVEDSIRSWNSQMNDTITVTGIQPKATYYLFVRHACDTADKSPWQSIEIKVPAEAATLPYDFGFEEATERSNWIIEKGSQYHFFTTGTDVSSSGTTSLYVTHDGTTNTYTDYNGSGAIASTTYAYRTFYLAAGTYEWQYDWHCVGEVVHINDYGRAFLAPQSVEMKAGTMLSGLSKSGVPSGCYAVDNGTLYDQATWTTSKGLVTINQAGYYNLAFVWTNDASAGENPPLAVDNVKLRQVFCLPVGITTSNITTSSMNLTFTKDDASTPVFYTVSTRDSYDVEDAIVSDTTSLNTVTINGLNASNVYYIYAKAICTIEDSPWERAVARTSCGIVQGLPYEMGFETLPVRSDVNNDLANICWSTVGVGAQVMSSNIAYPYYRVDNTEDYLHSGDRSLRMSSSSEAYLYLMLPEFAEKNDIRMYFWYRNGFRPTEADRLAVGYMTNGTFTELTVLDYATQMTYKLQDYPALPTGAKLAFRFGGQGTNNYAALDDIRVIKLTDGGTILDTICYESDYTRNGFNVAATDMTVGVNHLSRTSISEHATDMDTVYHADVYMRPQISSNTYDTICSGMPYRKGLFSIDNPKSKQYFVSYKSTVYPECDSIVSLWLHVIPGTSDIFDTICQGETYTFGGQQYSVTGDYVDIRSGLKGCPDTATLHLLVIDSVEHTYAQICNGDSYTFEGREYSNTGTYRVPVVGAHSCTINKVLHLKVLNSDTTYSVNICQGGQFVLGDTVITTAGSYVVTRRSPLGCDVTNRITVTVDPAIEGHVNDYACENQTYSGYGIKNLVVTNDTVVYVSSKKEGSMCDSIGVVHIRLEPIRRSTETKQIAAGESYTWNNNTYSKSGTYYAYLTSQETGCDSIATLILTVGTGVDNAENDGEIKAYPNPTTGIVYINVSDDIEIEVKDLTGRVVIRSLGRMVDLGGLADGIYFVNGIKVILKR